MKKKESYIDSIILRKKFPFYYWRSNKFILYSHLSEGDKNKLQRIHWKVNDYIEEVFQANLVWKEDLSHSNLCPSDMTPVQKLNDQKVCCAESYLYLHGYNKGLPSLSLPNTTSGVWSNQGSICFYLFFGSLNGISNTNHNTLFKWLPVNITYTYNNSTMITYFHRLDKEMVQLKFTLSVESWTALCFSFSVSGSSVQGNIFEGASYAKNETAPIISLSPADFSTEDIIRFIPDRSSSLIAFKNFMILSKTISYDEFHMLYWGNTNLYKQIGNVLAFWRLQEIGDFYEEIGGTYATRINSTFYAGISTKVSENLLSYLEPTEEIPLQEATGWLTLAYKGRKRAVHKSIIAYSIDFAKVHNLGYLQPFIVQEEKTVALMKESPGRASTAIISDYLGLRIQDYATYRTYYTVIETEISSGGVSIWFYSKTTASKPLISAWSSDGNTYFTYYVGTNLVIEIGLNQEIHSPTITVNTWHHLMLIWNTESTSFSSLMVLDGTASDSKSVNAFSINTKISPRLIIGAIYTGSGNIDPTNVFDGYVRRIDIVSWDTVGAPMSALISFAIPYAKQFLAYSNCNTQYASCSMCDIFSLECFSPFPHEKSPDGLLVCPAECSNTYFTSCDTQGVCSMCNSSLCISCTDNNVCLRCKEGSYESVNGSCVCDPGKALNSVTKNCEICDSTCSTCKEPGDPNKCFSCQAGVSLFLLDTVSGKCVDECPSGMRQSGEGICVINCHFSCASCSLADDEYGCTSCEQSTFLLGNTVGRCVSTCPINSTYIEGTRQCLFCDSTCATCLIPENSSACFTCNSTTPYKTETFLPSIGTCTSICLGSPTTYTDQNTKTCYINGNCPISTYKNTTSLQCEKCDESCFGCEVPNSSQHCLGCISPDMYLELSSKTSKSGKCVTKCGEDFIINKISRYCTPEDDTYNYEKGQAITQAINAASSAVTFSSIVSSLLVSGNIGAVAALMGPLQLLNLFSLINIPKVPVKLGLFFEGMGIVSFEFMPNIITWLIPESVTHSEGEDNKLEDNASYNVSLEGKMFLINIGNTITVFILVGLYVVITLILSNYFAFFNKQKAYLKSFVLEFIVLNYMELILSAVIQIRYFSCANFIFYSICSIIAIVTAVYLSYFLFYCWNKIHKHKTELHTDEIQQEIGCFFEEFSYEGWKKWSIVIFVGVRFFSCIFIVLTNKDAKNQVYCFWVINFFALIWTILIRPQKSKLLFIGALISECGTLFANGVYYKLCDSGLTKRQTEVWGDIIYYTFIFISVMNMVICFAKGIIDFLESLNKEKDRIIPVPQLDSKIEFTKEKNEENNITVNPFQVFQIEYQNQDLPPQNGDSRILLNGKINTVNPAC